MKLQRIAILVKKDLKKSIRQPAILFMLLLFPFMVTFVFGFAFGGIGGDNTTSFDIGLVDMDSSSSHPEWSSRFIDNLTELDGITIISYYDNSSGQSDLLQGNMDALLVIPEGFGDSCHSFWMSPLDGSTWINSTVELYVDSGSLMATSAVPPMIQQVVVNTLFGGEATSLDLPVIVGSPALVTTSTLTQWDFMAPGIFAFASIFMIMTVAQSMTTDRDGGLLKRMRTTPLTSSEFMVSQVVSNMVLAVVQVVLVFVSSFIIGYQPMTDASGVAFAFVIVTIFSLVSVGFGLIAATISKNAEVATGIAFVFIMPQMFLGTFMPLGGAAEIAGKFMPSNYVTHAITTLFLRGAPITSVSIWMDLAVVSLIGIFVLVVGITIFRKYGIRA